MTDPPTARWARRAFLPHGSAGGTRGTPVIAYETPAPPALGSLTPVGHRQHSMLAGARACAGACLRKLFWGSASHVWGLSRNPRPLAPARPHRARQLGVVPVTHAHSGGRGVRGEWARAAWRPRSPSARDGRGPQLAAETPPLSPRVPASAVRRISLGVALAPPPLPPPWLIERGVPSCQTVQGQFVRCGHR